MAKFGQEPLGSVHNYAVACGRLELLSASPFSEYWKMPEKTKTEFGGDEFFIAGDSVSRNTDGFIATEGKAVDLAISGGFNIYPNGIELVFDLCPDIAENATFGVPHSDLGEVAVAAVVAVDPRISIREIEGCL